MISDMRYLHHSKRQYVYTLERWGIKKYNGFSEAAQLPQPSGSADPTPNGTIAIPHLGWPFLPLAIAMSPQWNFLKPVASHTDVASSQPKTKDPWSKKDPLSTLMSQYILECVWSGSVFLNLESSIKKRFSLIPVWDEAMSWDQPAS